MPRMLQTLIVMATAGLTLSPGSGTAQLYTDASLSFGIGTSLWDGIGVGLAYSSYGGGGSFGVGVGVGRDVFFGVGVSDRYYVDSYRDYDYHDRRCRRWADDYYYDDYYDDLDYWEDEYWYRCRRRARRWGLAISFGSGWHYPAYYGRSFYDPWYAYDPWFGRSLFTARWYYPNSHFAFGYGYGGGYGYYGYGGGYGYYGYGGGYGYYGYGGGYGYYGYGGGYGYYGYGGGYGFGYGGGYGYAYQPVYYRPYTRVVYGSGYGSGYGYGRSGSAVAVSRYKESPWRTYAANSPGRASAGVLSDVRSGGPTGVANAGRRSVVAGTGRTTPGARGTTPGVRGGVTARRGAVQPGNGSRVGGGDAGARNGRPAAVTPTRRTTPSPAVERSDRTSRVAPGRDGGRTTVARPDGARRDTGAGAPSPRALPTDQQVRLRRPSDGVRPGRAAGVGSPSSLSRLPTDRGLRPGTSRDAPSTRSTDAARATRPSDRGRADMLPSRPPTSRTPTTSRGSSAPRGGNARPSTTRRPTTSRGSAAPRGGSARPSTTRPPTTSRGSATPRARSVRPSTPPRTQSRPSVAPRSSRPSTTRSRPSAAPRSSRPAPRAGARSAPARRPSGGGARPTRRPGG